MARILLVDDDDLLRKMLRISLVKMGHHVIEAINGKEALRLFDEELPDLVLTDLIMPDKEGLETITELRKSHPAVKIIAMSGGGRVGGVDYLKMAVSMGASSTLTKPFSNDDLIDALKALLE